MPNDPYGLVPGANSDSDIRDLAKKTFLALLNSESLRTLEPKNFSSDRYGMTKAEFRRQVIAAFPMLPGVFGSGIGVKLQREDSELAERVMSPFIEEGIPILPIHDSFIVARRHVNKLVDTMKGVFR